MSIGNATERKIDEVVNATRLYGSRNIIVLWGPPRTGKSFIALVAAQRYAGHELLVKTVQFHQSYTYDDFMEGFRPTQAGGFVPTDGIFAEWNKQALADPQNRYVLLIEELSRANIAHVLGELLTYIEYRERVFVTPITRSQMSVAPNLAIIATMNPRDRSALELDDAVISRLRILTCPPDSDQLGEILQESLEASMDAATKARIINALQNIFSRCKTDHPETYDEEMPFGHAMFAGIKDENDLTALWHQQILPLLRRPNVPPHPFYETIRVSYPWAQAQGAVEPATPEGGSQ